MFVINNQDPHGHTPPKIDKLVKSLKSASFVIPANPGSWSGAGAGIQYFQ